MSEPQIHSKEAAIFPAIPSHLFESTPRKGRRRGRRGKQAQSSPLGKTPMTHSSSTSPTTSAQSQSPPLPPRHKPLPHPLENREREMPPHLPPTSQLALAETVAIMRNSMRVLEEVQTSLESGLDEVHASLAATNERVDGLLEEMLVGQQQMMDLVVQIMERVMRIDRNIPAPN
ncbi:hypothetical protein L227DRAFT_650700 [Lentinus tigrinus ALCF2SS1-6]|uniref:Uncharacterized protein n=2 Tax=Lentinus tigrinus TaxID=5365 RepID=A0A5C2SIV4_9APHY|nr:hypothetical protein L227DRAFT_650700 [Lentinus tigrinus ALCF2SS1-6]